jgi:hypothetical protein
MATFSEVESLIRTTYDRVWRDWHGAKPSYKPADLVIELSDNAAGYSFSKDTIWNPLLEGNLDDCDVLDANAWPVWKIQLIHEMLHEFQFKAVTSSSPAGIALCSAYQKTFWGQNHDDRFFTAIERHAGYFNMTPEQLIKAI